MMPSVFDVLKIYHLVTSLITHCKYKIAA